MSDHGPGALVEFIVVAIILLTGAGIITVVIRAHKRRHPNWWRSDDPFAEDDEHMLDD